MRGFLVSFAVHAGALGALLVLPSFSQSELPPVRNRPIDEWPTPVTRVAVARARPLLPSRGASGRGGGGPMAPARPAAQTAQTAVISDEPLTPGNDAAAIDPELPPGTGTGPIGVELGPGSAEASQGPPQVVRANVDVQPPRKLSGIYPAYPQLARVTRIEAVIVLECTIDTDGHVRDVRLVTGHPLFNAATVDAVRTWRYTPTLLNGVPVAVLMTVTVNFTLTGR